MLKYFRDKQPNFNGFFFHWLNMETGAREWNSEVSTIDTALFLASAMFTGEYFKGTEVEEIATQLYKNANWQHYLNNDIFVSMGSAPEGGFISDRWNRYCEGLILDIMAIGSPTYPISTDAWHRMEKPVGTYKGMTSIASGPCFTHHYSQLYIDFRLMNDGFANYHINTLLAMLANRKFCIENQGRYKTFNEFSWGLTACDGWDGSYKVYGAPPGAPGIDGTAAPTCIGGSVAFIPTVAIRSLRYLYDNHKKFIWGYYKFVDSYNLDKNWLSDWIIGIDQAAIMLSIENFRSQFVWKYFMKNRYILEGLRRIGFKMSRGIPVSLEGEWQMKKLSHYQSYEKMIQDNSGWSEVNLPENMDYHRLKNYEGYIWFRKKFKITDSDIKQFSGEILGISLGAIDDVDVTYLNGVQIGGLGSFLPNYVTARDRTRVYLLPESLLKKDDENIIAVLVYSKGGTVGIYRGPLWIAPYEQLTFQSLKQTGIELKEKSVINLSGNKWKFQLGDNPEWKKVDFDDSDWKNIYVPKSWKLEGDKKYEGYAWYRYRLKLSSAWEVGINLIYIKSIGDVDEVYFNQVLIGNSGKFPPEFKSAQDGERVYTIPGDTIKYDSENNIAIRVYGKGSRTGIWRGPVVIKNFTLK